MYIISLLCLVFAFHSVISCALVYDTILDFHTFPFLEKKPPHLRNDKHLVLCPVGKTLHAMGHNLNIF